MPGGGDPQAVDGFDGDVQCRVTADAQVRPDQVVVDGGRDANHRQAQAAQDERAGLGAVAADDDQSFDAVLVQDAECCVLAFHGPERRATAVPSRVPAWPTMPPTSRAPSARMSPSSRPA